MWAFVFSLIAGTSLVVGGGVIILSTTYGYRVLFSLAGACFAGALVAIAIPCTVAKVIRCIAHLRWWHGLWFLVFLSGLVFRIRSAGASVENPLDPWASYRIGLMWFVAIVLLGAALSRRVNWVGAMFRGYLGLMTAYGLISLASSAWSVYPLWSAYKSLEYLVDLALAAAIVISVRTDTDLKSLFDLFWLLIGVQVAVVWLGVLIWPSQAVQRGVGLVGLQIQGVLPTVSTDEVGTLGMYLSLVGVARACIFPRDKVLYTAILLGGLVTLFFAQARAPLVALLSAVLLTFVVTRRLSLLMGFAILVMSVAAITNGWLLFQEYFLRGQSPALFWSLSGRVTWWQEALPFILRSPVLGNGAYVGRFLSLASHGEEFTSSLHNTWIEILIGTGLLGLLPVMAAVLGAWKTLLNDSAGGWLGGRSSELRAEGFLVLVVLSIRSMVTPAFIWHPPNEFLLVLICSELLRRRIRIVQRERLSVGRLGLSTV